METPDGWGMLGLHKIIISLASYALRILPSTRMGNSGCLDGQTYRGRPDTEAYDNGSIRDPIGDPDVQKAC